MEKGQEHSAGHHTGGSYPRVRHYTTLADGKQQPADHLPVMVGALASRSSLQRKQMHLNSQPHLNVLGTLGTGEIPGEQSGVLCLRGLF